MSKFVSRILGYFSSRTLAGMDTAGNRYFTKIEEIDGRMKERRFVIFKGEDDPTLLPVEWICWLSGQRKKAPTPQEMIELEAQRERVKLNVAILQEEEEKKKSSFRQSTGTDSMLWDTDFMRIDMVDIKVGGPDLKSFIQQFPGSSVDKKRDDGQTVSDATVDISDKFRLFGCPPIPRM